MTTPDEPTRVLILDPDVDRALELSELLRAQSNLYTTVAERADPRILRGAREERPPFDVVVVSLQVGPSGGVVAAHEAAVHAFGSEIVLFSNDVTSPECEAARSLGIARILAVDVLLRWLPGAASALGRVVRARRELQRCTASVPDLPSAEVPACPAATGALVPLHDAERRFREAYLQGVMSGTSTRREAARRAGVPYRTLSQMMSKLRANRGDP